ncbi:very short patch repair endonuclease [Pelagimonas sp. KU-00592-HH]|uniref:very short patch repair endonuclease n=1 Tax=Pelagimonas sp. KU-00592-HH TaxID=3127651 RepID=UPI00334299CF
MPEKRQPMTRSEMMGNIGSRNTKPEMIVRRGIHRLGFRYSLHRSIEKCKPDLVLPKYRAVIFVHGCFWHAHQGCHFFRLPKTRTDFWKKKLAGNVERDKKFNTMLMNSGWRVLTIWECATRNQTQETLAEQIAAWLRSDEISGFMPSELERLN